MDYSRKFIIITIAGVAISGVASYLLFQKEKSRTPTPIQNEETTNNHPDRAVDNTQAESTVAEDGKSSIEKQQTPLRLKVNLLSVFNNRIGKASTTALGKDQSYMLAKEGDEIAEKVYILEIRRDSVLIDNQGSVELISFSSNESVDKPSSRSHDSDEKPINPGPANSNLEKQRNSIIAKLRLEPVSDGVANGYIIGNITDEAKAFGLETGDVLMSINGHVLGLERNDFQAIESVWQYKAATILIKRDGELISFSKSM